MGPIQKAKQKDGKYWQAAVSRVAHHLEQPSLDCYSSFQAQVAHGSRHVLGRNFMSSITVVLRSNCSEPDAALLVVVRARPNKRGETWKQRKPFPQRDSCKGKPRWSSAGNEQVRGEDGDQLCRFPRRNRVGYSVEERWIGDYGGFLLFSQLGRQKPAGCPCAVRISQAQPLLHGPGAGVTRSKSKPVNACGMVRNYSSPINGARKNFGLVSVWRLRWWWIQQWRDLWPMENTL